MKKKSLKSFGGKAFIHGILLISFFSLKNVIPFLYVAYILYICLFIYKFICLLFHLLVYLFIFLIIYLFVCLFVYNFYYDNYYNFLIICVSPLPPPSFHSAFKIMTDVVP